MILGYAKMAVAVIAIIGIVGGVGYVLKLRSDNAILKVNNKLLEDSVAQQQEALEKSRQVIAQTDALGNTIINDMENQKETLIDAQMKVDETRGFTSNAKDVLVAMGNRALKHTACVALVILILMGLNGLIIYFAFVKK